jgi:hypothetical protein
MKRIVLLLAIVGAGMLDNPRAEARRQLREFRQRSDAERRFVDMGVVLNVVRRDFENGRKLLSGAPPLTIVRSHAFGGMIDRAADPIRLCGPSLAPRHWYCSEQAEPLILHRDDLPPSLLVYGSMGAGKTVTLAQWLYLRALEFTGLGIEIGATAPTSPRLAMIFREARDLWPSNSWTWKERDQTFTLANDVVVRLVSTHQSSKAEGSRVQGYTWGAHAGDELQDQLEVNGDIEARGRGAPGGIYRRFNSATAKDDTTWRNFRAEVDANPQDWLVQHLFGLDSPFQYPAYWEGLKRRMSLREYQRKVLALDVAPDDRLYSSYSRTDNIRPRPRVGAKDVTAQELARFGYDGTSLLLGHDPGLSVDYSLVLKAFQVSPDPKVLPAWWVVGELETKRKTTEGHVVELKKYLSTRWNQKSLIHCDPHGVNSRNDDERPDITVLRTFQSHGFTIRPAAYSPGTNKPGQIPREARIDLVNTLLCDASGNRRVFIDCDDQGQPVAPRLVEALERQQRDAEGKAERVKKGSDADLTHYTCALGYALFPIEKPRIVDVRRVG